MEWLPKGEHIFRQLYAARSARRHHFSWPPFDFLGPSLFRPSSAFIMFPKNKTEQLSDIGRMLVLEALDRTKGTRKAGADMFANYGLEKHAKT